MSETKANEAEIVIEETKVEEVENVTEVTETEDVTEVTEEQQTMDDKVEVSPEEDEAEPAKEEAPDEESVKEEIVDDGAKEEESNKEVLESKPKKQKQNNKPKRMYERSPELEKILTMTVKTLRAIPHVTNVDCRSKNNRHFALRVESNKIANLFLHGINNVGIYSNSKDLISALEKVLTHWNDNLGILPDDCFNVCVYRLQLAEQQTVEPSSASMMANEEIRKRIYLHYASSRYEWRSLAIKDALELADSLECKTTSSYGLSTRLRKNTAWTPELESMEEYFGVHDDCLGDIETDSKRLREVGRTMRVLGIRNRLVIGHLVKINAMRKRHMAEIAEGIRTGEITLAPIDVEEVDVESLKDSMLSFNRK